MRHAGENREMFNSIAYRYDLLNRLISLGFDKGWRKKTVSLLNPLPGRAYLDIGTGTADLALEILRREPTATVVGIDPAVEMLGIAEIKIADAGLHNSVSLQVGDAMSLPYRDNSFSGAVTGFCIRNIEDRHQALREILRVLRKGSTLSILELSVPSNRILSTLHLAYGRTVLPMAARLLSRERAYQYLVESVRAYPAPIKIVDMLLEAGFSSPRVVPLLGGVATITLAEAE